VAGSLGYVRVEAGEDIQIRSLNAISGDVAFLGIPNERSIRIIAEGVSNQTSGQFGRIKGFGISLGTGLDDLCSADGGAAAAQMIVADEQVVGVVGTSCSGAAAAAAPLISAAGMVMISPSNTSPSLTSDLAGTAGSNNYPGYYRTAHNDLFQGAAAAGFAVDVLGVSTAAAIHDGDPYTQGLAQAFADAFEALGGTITTFTAVNKGDTDMVPVLTEVASGSPEMLFFPIFQPEGNFIVQQVHEVSGMDGVTLMAADGLMVSNFMEIPESEGLYFSGPDLRYGNNRNQSLIGGSAEGFLSVYGVVYGEKPSAAFWAHSVDATTLLLEAIDAASHLDEDGTLVIDRAGVREFLSNVRDYQGFTGLLSCDEFGDCGSQKITVIGHTNSSDVDGSLANVIYEYSPAGGSQVGLLYDFSAASEIIQDYVDENGLNGASFIVVDRDDGVVHQEHFGELGPGRVAIIGPVGEMISAGVVLSLHDDGLLDVDAPVADVVAWGSGNPEVTLAQLLSHSSGMVGGPASQFYNPYLCSVMFVGSLQGCAETIFTTPDDDADLVQPDTAFGWPGTGADYQVAGAVAEVASGKTWAELVDEIYVQPCGLNVLAYNNPWFQLPFDPTTFGYPAVGGDPVSMLAPTENPSIMGGAYTTADDLAALLLMHLRDGMCGDERVLSTESLERMHEDRIARVYDGDSEFTDAEGNATGEVWGYGMGFPIDRETGQPATASPFGQQAWLDLDEGYAVLLLLEASWTNSLALYDLVPGPVHEAILTARG
jgi:branched-chain amino acid transport system substrate-binding protein